MKLFDDEKTKGSSVGDESLGKLVSLYSSEEDTTEADMASLESYVNSYVSVGRVYDQIVLEGHRSVDSRNYVLFNEYMAMISKNLGVSVSVVSQESIEESSLASSLALEGLIGSMFSKIKELFVKIYDAIKKFFVSYFTRLGRIKKKLQNLKEVLQETDKDIKNLVLEKAPGALISKFPIGEKITVNVVNRYLDNASIVKNILTEVNAAAKQLAKKEVFDRDFVASIKNLRELAKKNESKVRENIDEKTTGLKSFYGKGREKNKAIDAENKDLKQIANDAKEEANEKEGEAIDIGNSSDNAGVEINEKGFELAKKELKDFMELVEKSFNELKDKPLVNGDVVKSVTVKEEEGIEIEIENDKDNSDNGASLAGKADLLELIDKSIKLLDGVEKLSSSYGEINDTIMESVGAVEKTIREIDGIKIENLGKYRTVLSNKVRDRLRLMKVFFNNYNKINKKLFSIVVDNAEGTSSYAVVSLKNFG